MKGKRYTSSLEWASEPGRYAIGEGSCWNWLGRLDSDGYGQTRRVGQRSAHRAFYSIFVGPIPEGFEVDHRCKNRRCVNPKHLEAVPPLVNRQRSAHRNRVKTHCIRGHALEGYNVMAEVGPDGKPRRRCRTCSVANKRHSRAAARQCPGAKHK